MTILKQTLKLLLISALLEACGSQSVQNTTPVSTAPWKGEWQRSERMNHAMLTIDSAGVDSVHFVLVANSGGNTGDLEGGAKVIANKAVFEVPAEGDTCRIVFVLQGDSMILVDQQRGVCFAGAGVGYSGKYYRGGRLADQNLEDKGSETGSDEEGEGNDDLIALGIFKNSAEDSVFRALVKNDYSLFVNSTQMVSEDEDLDSLHSRVTSAGVRGLYTQMENIIMIDTAKHIWAAVIDDGKVNYYSNHLDFLEKLPRSIEHWRERFKEYRVINKSR